MPKRAGNAKVTIQGISNEAPRRIRSFCHEYRRNADDAYSMNVS